MENRFTFRHLATDQSQRVLRHRLDGLATILNRVSGVKCERTGALLIKFEEIELAVY